jgi:hypothetical protein
VDLSNSKPSKAVAICKTSQMASSIPLIIELYGVLFPKMQHFGVVGLYHLALSKNFPPNFQCIKELNIIFENYLIGYY